MQSTVALSYKLAAVTLLFVKRNWRLLTADREVSTSPITAATLGNLHVVALGQQS